ncbi:M14 family metallopeptidase [Clostridium peptidivorans]|uniref:M14 family metallopeptidase n=1 Tax=Clostridium peptidivorans TaxID=100174 RepID=UPI000BE36FA2|nr:M14 family metallopeptidase [Clostridium peptidivorans]
MRKSRGLALALALVSVITASSTIYAGGTNLKPSGPWVNENQNISLSSLHDYEELSKTLKQIEKSSKGKMQLSTIGKSNQGRDIYLAKVGTGPKKVMVISQQHGNEPLGTEAALSVLKYLSTDNNKVKDILSEVTVYIVPRVNVDGTEKRQRYTDDPTAPKVSYTQPGVGYDMNRWHWQNWEDSPYYKMDNGKTFPTNPVKESVAVLNAFKAIQPEWIIDLHHQGTYLNEENGNMIKTSILWPTDPKAKPEAVELSKKMCSVLYNHLEHFGFAEVSKYDGGAYEGIARNSYGIAGAGSVLIEMRGQMQSLGQKSSGYLTKTFVESIMSLVSATADGSLYEADTSIAENMPETGPYVTKDGIEVE